MSWEVYTGLVVFAGIWCLVTIAGMFKTDDSDDAISSSIKSLFKTVFIGSALIFSAVAIGNVENVTRASLNSSDTALVDNFIAGNNALYHGMINTNMVFVFFLLLFIIFMVFRNLKRHGDLG